MNKIYKVVWSKVKNCYVVVSELAKNVITGSVKSAKIGSTPMAKGLALGAMMAFVITGSAMAADYSERQVVDGGSYDGKSFTVTSTGVSYGGALYNTGTLTIINNSELNGNVLVNNSSYCYGGAIYNANGAELNITNTNFEYNKTQNTSTKNGQGGAIYNAGGELDIVGGTFKGNVAQAVTADGGIQFAMGGAIYNGGDGSLTVTGTTFEENKGNEGGAIVTNGGPTVITDSTFKNNEASMGGGAINIRPDKTVTLNGVNTFENNKAVEGGAVKLYSNSVLDINGTATFTGNTANGVANDIYNDGIVNINEGAVVTLNGGMNGNGTTKVDGTLVLGNDSTMASLASNNGTLAKAEGTEKVTVTLTGLKDNPETTNKNEATGTALKGNANVNISGVDLAINSEGTAIYNQDITIKSDSDVAIKSQQQGISAYGDVVIEAANVTIESVDNGIQSVADANPNDVGNVTIKATEDVNIKATTEGYAVTNVSKNGGVIDIEGKNVTLVSGNRTAVKVGHEVGQTGYNGTINVTGETITIEGAAKEAEEGQYRQSAAVLAQGSETELNLNASDTITIKNTGNTEGSAIGAYDGAAIEVAAGGDVSVAGQVNAWQQTVVDISGKNVTLTNDGADTVRGVGATINITADENINITTVEKDGIQACASDINLNAKNVVIDADAWGINVTADAGSNVVINAENIEITGVGAADGDMGAIRNLAESEVILNATNNIEVVGDIYAAGKGVITLANGGSAVFSRSRAVVEGDIYAKDESQVNVGFRGEGSALRGNVYTDDAAETNLSFTDGATWYADGSKQGSVTNLEVNDANIVIDNANENAITVGTLSGSGMNVEVDAAKEGTVIVEEEEGDVRVSVSTNGVTMNAAVAKGYQGVVKTAAGESIVDEINANNTYISGDVKFEADENGDMQVVETTLNGDVKVNGNLTADNLYTKDEIDKYRDEANQNVEERFEAVEEKTQNITASEGKTTFKTNGNGKITIKDIEGNTMLYGTDAAENYTVGINAETGGVDSKHINVGNGAFVANETGAAVKGSLTVNGNQAITGGLSVGTDVVANGTSLKATADQVEANKQAIEDNKAAIETNKAEIETNASNIEANKQAIEDNKAAIEANKSDIKDNADNIAANAGAIADNKAAIAQNASDIQANRDAIQEVQNVANQNAADIAENKAAIAENAGKIQANTDAINKEIADRISADAELQANLDAEAQARQDADNALSDAIDNVAGDIVDTKAQVQDNKAAIEQNAQDLANEVADRVAADNKLQAKLDKEAVDRQIADAQERAERITADAKEEAARIEADAKERAERIEADAKEAQARQEADAALDQKFTDEVGRLDNRIDKVEDRVDKVGAMAAAMASLKTMGYDPEAPTEIAVGIGQYRNETGLAIGAFHYPNKDFMLNFSLSTAGDEVMGGIGATWKIGRKKPAGETMEDKVAKAEAMKEAAKEARVKAQQARHAKMLAEKAK